MGTYTNKINMNYDPKYMSRALELAARGRGFTSPNPMVGAVIVHDDRIIGEGWHRRWGEGHAEVNAVASVKERHLLPHSTMYVTLEPCSHYGKTPPCAKLIIDNHIPRVVVAAGDPFKEVAGRGITMLREAGVEVVEGVLAEESRRLNSSFFTAHTIHRPFITLKWAQSADGFMDHERAPGQPAARFSTLLTSLDVHRLRSCHDAILTSAATVNADNPMLDTRRWQGRSPRPVIIDRQGTLNPRARILQRAPIIFSGTELTLDQVLSSLYRDHGITSVLVEAGPRLLSAFIEAELWDEARVETAPFTLGENGTFPAPTITVPPVNVTTLDGHTIATYQH